MFKSYFVSADNAEFFFSLLFSPIYFLFILICFSICTNEKISPIFFFVSRVARRQNLNN